MRRMYSQAELSAIIKKVFLEDVASGEIDLPALVTEALPDVDWSEFELDCKSVKANSIIENMSGYSYVDKAPETTLQYLGVVKNGNKITFVASGYILSTSSIGSYTSVRIARITIPSSIGTKLVSNDLGYLEQKRVLLFNGLYTTKNLIYLFQKNADNQVEMIITTGSESIGANDKYNFRVETTFLLGDNLAPSGE